MRSQVPQNICGGQTTTFGSWFSPTTWALVSELQPSGLEASTFTHWAIVLIDQRVYNLGPLHICYGCVALSLYETSHSGKQGCLWLHCLLWGFFSPNGLTLLALPKKEEPSLITTWYAMIGWFLWEACSFLKWNRWVDLG